VRVSNRCEAAILAAALLASCTGSPDVTVPPAVTAAIVDDLPPLAVSSRPHVGSLSAHSFTREGGDQQPSPAPDGSWFAFTSTCNSVEPQIYRQSSSGSVVTQLTQGSGAHIQPAVAPNGREIAFAGRDDGSWDVWIIPAGGGAKENLTATSDLDEIGPAWHPNGRMLAYSSMRADGGEWWICAASRGASGVSWIVPGFNPHWSPAGDTIVFQRAKKRGREENSLWTVRVSIDSNGLVTGGAESQIVANPSWGAVEPAFSPDGKRIVFTAIEIPRAAAGEAPRGGDIWCVRVDGTDLIRLTNTPEPDWDPAWAGEAGAPTVNGRVFFASERTGTMNIWSLMPVLEGSPSVLAPAAE
jgi:Tol biopolymer transport system component